MIFMHCFEQNWDDKALRAVLHLACLLMYYALEEDLIESTERLQAPPLLAAPFMLQVTVRGRLHDQFSCNTASLRVCRRHVLHYYLFIYSKHTGA